MGLTVRTLPALFNGVSQQPAILRSADQTEDELNTWSSLVSGVGKRPPTETVAKLPGNFGPSPFIHYINRDASERYVAVIDSGAIRVFTADGVEKTVAAPGGLAYVASGALRAVTVADYTFIVNTTKVCEMDAPVTTATLPAPPEYEVPVGREATFSPVTTNKSQPDWQAGPKTPKAEGDPPPTVPGNGNYVGEVVSMEKLPENAAEGDIYKVTGSAGSGFRSYYVRRTGAVWDETVANGLRNSLKRDTMPHCLIRNAEGNFVFAPFSWTPRSVGDTDSNPAPTFVGRTIRDVFFYQNRLGSLVDENVVFSCAGDFGNFWRSTVLDSIDSDVVDVAVTGSGVALLNHAVPFADGVVLFADQQQFSLTNGENGVTPASVAIRPVTAYAVNPLIRPVALGTEIYFVGDGGGSSAVWEYTRNANTEATTAAEITAHVPTLLPPGLRGLASLGRGLLALTGGKQAFAYQFYWSGDEKIQSAWRPWEFSGDLLAATLVDDSVHLVVRHDDGIYLERMSLAPAAKPASQPHRVFLDRQVERTGTYDPATHRTTFTLPYAPRQETLRIVRGNASDAPHSLIDPSGYLWSSPTTLSVPGNEAAGPCVVGVAYDFRLKFSRQFAVTPQGVPRTTGRLQLRTFTVAYADAAFFEIEVQPYGNNGSIPPQVIPVKTTDVTGRVIGSAAFRLNEVAYRTGSETFTVYGDAAQATIELKNPTHFGATFVSAEWEGFFHARAY